MPKGEASLGSKLPPPSKSTLQKPEEFAFDFEYLDGSSFWSTEITGSGEARLGFVFRKGHLLVAGGDFKGDLKLGPFELSAPKHWAVFLAVLDFGDQGWVQATQIGETDSVTYGGFFSNSKDAGMAGNRGDRKFELTLMPNAEEKEAGFKPEISVTGLNVTTYSRGKKESGFGRLGPLLGPRGTMHMAAPGGTTADPAGPPPPGYFRPKSWRILLRRYQDKPRF